MKKIYYLKLLSMILLSNMLFFACNRYEFLSSEHNGDLSAQNIRINGIQKIYFNDMIKTIPSGTVREDLKFYTKSLNGKGLEDYVIDTTLVKQIQYNETGYSYTMKIIPISEYNPEEELYNLTISEFNGEVEQKIIKYDLVDGKVIIDESHAEVVYDTGKVRCYMYLEPCEFGYYHDDEDCEGSGQHIIIACSNAGGDSTGGDPDTNGPTTPTGHDLDEGGGGGGEAVSTECTGGKIKDASGNCVCPQGKEENSFGNCVTPCDTSKEDLKKVFPYANDIILQDMANAINKYGKDFGINTKEKLQHFLAQAGHESAKFSIFTENLNYRWEKLGVSNFKKYFNPISSPNLDPNKANPNDYKRSSTSVYVDSEKLANYVYGNRMGNDTYGDGYKYRGRGIFQLTGKSNYTAFNNFYKINYNSSVDIINNPDLLMNNKEIMVISALWYYKNNVLNKISVNGSTSVKSVSVKVNGGTNGLNDRIQIFNIAINIIKCL